MNSKSRTPLDLTVQPNVGKIRAKTALTQAAFAKRYGFSLSSVQNWEIGHRPPSGAAKLLLLLVKRYPNQMDRMINGREGDEDAVAKKGVAPKKRFKRGATRIQSLPPKHEVRIIRRDAARLRPR